MAISTSIQALLAGEQVAGSKLSRKLLDELLAEGMLWVSSHGSRKSYRARDTEALKRFLMDKDESYRILEVNLTDSRASMAMGTGNSKLVTIRSCPGFPVNSYEPVECFLDGKPFMVNPQEGSFLFVSDWEKLTIPEDVVVIGVENMENFRTNRILFVSRYPQSTDLRRWLCSIPNHYLHFGDFDLAGINIFLVEFQQYLGKERSSYLIPDDIESRLKAGSNKRYDEQYSYFKDIKSDVFELQQLIALIHRERKAYDQEGYICCHSDQTSD